MKAKIDLEKFICSYVKWSNIQDALKDQGLKCCNDEIVYINEDERIRKTLIKFHKGITNIDGIKGEEIISWLEKHEPNPQGKIALEAIKEEKFDNTNKVEQKFEIIQDAWYICTCTTCSEDSRIWFKKGTIYLGKEILKYDLGFEPDDYQNYFRIWTIKDAKDGDVLVGSRGDAILIFRGIGNTKWNDVIDYHCYYDCYHKDFIIQKDVDYWGNIENNQLVPATKEQRELLFKKMHDADYKWDEKNKELRKIEQVSAWSEEDEGRLDIICGLLEDIPSHQIWLKGLKNRMQLLQKVTCNEKDKEKLEMIINKASYNCLLKNDDISWLKSLKQRML